MQRDGRDARATVRWHGALRFVDMAESGFDGSQHGIDAEIHQVHAGNRDDDTAVQDDAGVKDVVEDVEEREFGFFIAAEHRNVIRARAHDSWDRMATKEYGGQGPVHPMRKWLPCFR